MCIRDRPGGQEKMVSMDPEDTVIAVKRRTSKAHLNHSLLLGTTALEDSRTLGSYKIENGDVLHIDAVVAEGASAEQQQQTIPPRRTREWAVAESASPPARSPASKAPAVVFESSAGLAMSLQQWRDGPGSEFRKKRETGQKKYQRVGKAFDEPSAPSPLDAFLPPKPPPKPKSTDKRIKDEYDYPTSRELDRMFPGKTFESMYGGSGGGNPFAGKDMSNPISMMAAMSDMQNPEAAKRKPVAPIRAAASSTASSVLLEGWLQAAKDGDEAGLARMLDEKAEGLDVDGVIDTGNLSSAKNRELVGRTAMALAARYGRNGCLTLLIERSASLSKVPSATHSPLFAAVGGRSEDLVGTVQLLLDAKCDIGELDENGISCLHHAIDKKRFAVVPTLLQHGSDFNLQDNRGFSPLAKAVAKSDVETIGLLLDKKADPSTQADSGMTPLGTACRKGNVQAVRMLLQAGAHVDANAALVALGNNEVEDVLCEESSRPELYKARNLDGSTALHCAAADNDASAARRVLAQWKDDGLQVDTQDQQGSSALMAAVRQGSEDCVAMLIESSADVDLQDSDGNTALHHADEANQPMMFKMLVEDGGADMELCNNKGAKPRAPAEGECVLS
eukprot:TRINITY_DN5133_c0_g1_i2.p1 TRINITY_DN5133_c0_g1~~TRINITY_DN5133_c0_g1_i2.p1  ORF type:complete len:619 (+),score=177.92 TRINITY_DN5133_c0_g1_i2:138-1994(+)